MKSKPLTIGILTGLAAVISAAWVMNSMRESLVICNPGINALFSLEMPWHKARVNEIISAWGDNTSIARTLNSIDFIIIFGYTVFFYFGVRKLILCLPEIYGGASKLLVAAALLPGCLELIENGIIFLWLNGRVDAFTPVFVSALAVIKLIIAIPMAFIVIGGLISLLIKKIKFAKFN